MNPRWTAMTVSADATHHLLDGEPAYGERFDEVLKFHAPGLAPVLRVGEAWHVRDDGSPAYERRFARAFGFYEGRAAVVSREGWHHVSIDGRDAYAERYAWCGNYQGGRAVVRAGRGAYLHLDVHGRPAYAQRWSYAGDYRDGAAVVKGDDGLATHVDLDGRPLHDRWFADLDVFHKGHARARDREGWFHVDPRGEALYRHRFAMVEPFYNGQAFAERHDGAQVVIGHDGAPVLEVCAGWSMGRASEGARPGPRVLLIGLGAAGKTTVGRLLASRWRVPLVSLDDCRRRWGDGSVAGDHLARAMFLRACGALDAGVFETSGAGAYRHATRAALLERPTPVVVCWLDVPHDVRHARREAPPGDVPYPVHAQGVWRDDEAEATLRGDLASGWWTEGPGWNAHRLDATRPAEVVADEIHERVSRGGAR